MKVPNKIKYILHKDWNLLKQLGIVLLMMTIARVIFYFLNSNVFYNVSILDFIAGIWMDAITIGLYFLPYYILYSLPFPFFDKKWYQNILTVLFHIINSSMLALNLIDVEYYRYTSKRSTADLFSMVTTGNDVNQLITTFISDFWWLILIFILLIIGSIWLYKQTQKCNKGSFSYLLGILNLFIITAIMVIIGRGGFVYRPADMLTAAKLRSPQKVGLVGNTPLSIIKTIGKPALKEVHYFPKGSPKIYQPIYNSADSPVEEKPNIMIIVLESFGNEWIGHKSGKSFTPFFDSLLDQSLYLTNAYANGKKSIEAIPSIFAGIPSLLDNPYISSQYGTNQITSLPNLLDNLGYTSAFYHGATNGSMNFDVFTAEIGFDYYFGRNEYNNDEDFDGTWGIMDEYFLPWTAKNITKNLQEPFLAGLFTLSSHHPYFVPKEYRDSLPKGEYPMSQAIAYADLSLRKFFQTAKKQPWYKHTIFIFTSDHTPTGIEPRYSRWAGMYQIPIAIFTPSGKISPKKDGRIFNQIDIMPTVLDLIGYPKDAYAFGNSYFSSDSVHFAINYIQGSYLYFQGDYLIDFSNNKTKGLFNYKIDTLVQYDSLAFYPKKAKVMTKELKGFIQRYNHDLINNTMQLK